MTDDPFTDHFATRACAHGCIRKGTEGQDVPEIMGAIHGNFCAREYYAIKSALEQAGEIIEHVVSLIGTSANSDDNVQATREPPLPFNMQAFNDANETYSRLAYWTQHWAKKLNRPPAKVAVGSWSNANGTTMGMPADTSPGSARVMVTGLAVWLRSHLELIMESEPADDVLYMHDELQDVYRIAARWPFKMKPRFAKIPCPQDGTRIAVYPPETAGADMQIVCDNGHVYDEERFEFYIREFAQLQADKSKGEKTRARLTKKYVA